MTLDALLESSLPQAPYGTNKGKSVPTIQHVWYRGGQYRLLACTLARHARNNCSVRTTEFLFQDGRWLKGSEDAVLCDVLVSVHNTSLERAPER